MKKLRNLKALLLVFVAAVALEATALVQFFYSQKGLREEAELRAESELESTRYEIMDIIDQAEAAVRNSVWIAQWCLNNPDSLHRVCERIVADNPVVAGSTIALVPGYRKDRPLFSPYACREADGTIKILSLATEDYDYPSQEWFVKPLELGEGYWSEPYVDEGGGEMLMTTYSLPLRDVKGKSAAVMTADISLEWLKELVGRMNVYPNAYCTVDSREGHVMVSPPEEQDPRSMVFETTVERTGWTISLVIPESDIFGVLRRVGTIVGILQLLGLLIIILMLQSFIRGERRFRELDKQRERVAGELKVATGIQMSMVPKTFPPFPERADLDMAATIVPAKEVGGDLYDFFLRGNKLFFCVGDVSGKGVPAALVMAVTRTTFRNLSAREDSPGRIVQAMNDSLSDMNENNMFVTFFCGVLDLTNGHLRYCNAGHNPPLVLTDAMRDLPVEPNLPLGVLPGMEFKEQETPFCYDDAIFLYTDGLTEAENIDHEQFGEDRMRDALHGRKSAQDHVDKVKQEVAAFVGDAPQSDDLTILFIHYVPSAHRLVLPNDIGQIPRLPAFVEEAVKMSKLPAEVEGSLNLALEEAVTNVMLYAYPEGTQGEVIIDMGCTSSAVSFTITDSGKPFDPTAKQAPDLSLGVDERPIGGLGIHLIRQIMDDVRYERRGDKNVLILTKNY